MSRIALIGPGRHGTAIAVLLARHGHDVTLFHHNPDKAARAAVAVRAVAADGVTVTVAAELRAAVTAADVVILATLWNAPQREVLGAVAELLPGKLLVDISNPLDVTPSGIHFAHPTEGSAGGFVATLLPAGTGHVKVFSHLGTEAINDGADLHPLAVLPFLADSQATAERIRPVLASLGWLPWLVGDISNSAALEIGGRFNTALGARGKARLTAAEFQALAGSETQL